MKLTKSLIFCFLSVLFSVCGQAQDSSNKGKVFNKNGLPATAVSILIKGTAKTASSNGIVALTIYDSYCVNNSLSVLLV